MSNVTLKGVKAKPFGSHFATRLESVNSKLICALSRTNIIGGGTCVDDAPPPPPPPPPVPVAADVQAPTDIQAAP